MSSRTSQVLFRSAEDQSTASPRLAWADRSEPAHHTEEVGQRRRGAGALSLDRSLFELAMASEGIGVWLFDLQTQRIEWSDGVYAVLGVKDFDGTRDAWLSMIHPEDRPHTKALFAHSMVEPPPFSAEFRIVRQDGVVAWVSNTANIVFSDEGVPTAVVGTVRDITARKRSEWALTAYNRVLELIASGAGLSETLSAVVAMVEEQLPGSLCSVLTVERGAGRLRVGAAPSLPESYNAVVDGLRIAPTEGSCGAAAFYGQTVVATDIASDPLWTEYGSGAVSWAAVVRVGADPGQRRRPWAGEGRGHRHLRLLRARVGRAPPARAGDPLDGGAARAARDPRW